MPDYDPLLDEACVMLALVNRIGGMKRCKFLRTEVPAGTLKRRQEAIKCGAHVVFRRTRPYSTSFTCECNVLFRFP